jgi:protein required for attachment to host cells
MKPRQDLYLLASDHAFRLLRGRGADLAEIAHHKADDFADVKDKFPASASRGHSSGASFGMIDRGAHEAEERRRLARHALQAVEAEWAKGKDDGIILVAGPKMLGTLRDLVPKALTGQVTAELGKDLVKAPLHDLPGHFQGLAGV